MSYFSILFGQVIAVITVEPAVMQTRRTGQDKAILTLSPRLHVKPLITVITAIRYGEILVNFLKVNAPRK